ncbi:SUZ domain-containing protein 1 isoform X6 [Myotis lucifugus]|uniref:SUZ domain-containing protein 1 isoform X6 n=1 Tax=Myotis lucifugus TaxID=59463 RepID=UPI000CCC5944|nr:SUZ domain-containing protein 1 isoform X6 [Myotis lucifugus]
MEDEEVAESWEEAADSGDFHSIPSLYPLDARSTSLPVVTTQNVSRQCQTCKEIDRRLEKKLKITQKESLGQCFHCQALFLGSSFTPTPPRAAYQSALVREGSLLRSSSEEEIQISSQSAHCDSGR